MVHPSSAQSFSTADTKFIASLSPILRPRMRTLSLLSICSGTSVRSVFEITKGEATVTLSQRPEKHEAWGSFIPLRSATTCLREFISVPPYTNQSSPEWRLTPSSSHWKDNKPSSPKAPYITRTLSDPGCPPSPTSSSSSMISHHVQSDLHPILARLESKSKLCSQKAYCATCRKPGIDFPRCGRCGEMWCSRPCRLVGGKRHVCSSST